MNPPSVVDEFIINKSALQEKFKIFRQKGNDTIWNLDPHRGTERTPEMVTMWVHRKEFLPII